MSPSHIQNRFRFIHHSAAARQCGGHFFFFCKVISNTYKREHFANEREKRRRQKAHTTPMWTKQKNQKKIEQKISKSIILQHSNHERINIYWSSRISSFFSRRHIAFSSRRRWEFFFSFLGRSTLLINLINHFCHCRRGCSISILPKIIIP